MKVWFVPLCVCIVCVSECVCACMRACVRACVRASVHERERVGRGVR